MKQKKHQNNTVRVMQEYGIREIEGEGNERKVILSFSSEIPYNRWSYTEVLDHSIEAVDLTRLSEIGCLLYNHNRELVIGKINRVWVDNNRGNAEVQFDEDEKSEEIFKKVKSGTLKGVSVGYIVNNWEIVEKNQVSMDGKFQGPVDIAKKWCPYEISIVSVPADPSVGVGRDLEDIQDQKKESLEWLKRKITLNKNHNWR